MAEGNESTAEITLKERDHNEGCPGIDSDERIEWHDTVATTGPYKGKLVTIIRCPDCGGQRVQLAENQDDDEE